VSNVPATDPVASESNTASKSNTANTVGSYNEWDPLEEVIVGVIDGAAVPPWNIALEATMPPGSWEFYRRNGGGAFPERQVEAAHAELEGFVQILQAEGVTVHRPEVVDQSRAFGTPDWQSTGGSAHTFPRDIALIAGDQIIEATMGWRSYYFATHPFRSIFKDCFRRGARWIAAPKPEMTEASYNPDYADVTPGGSRAGEPFPPEASVITEFEPLIDAGDFMRFGRDILVQRSHVTNRFGIEWVRRALDDRFRVHEVAFVDDHPMHMNATFVPLRPGKVLVNPERVPRLPPMFAGWDVMVCPEPAIPAEQTMYFCSRWICMNTLMLDQERVFVEANEVELIRLFEKEGFTAIPVPFSTVNTFGGGFHCATLDLRRRGGLEDYFTS
jgi:glycine amidinotransferase